MKPCPIHDCGALIRDEMMMCHTHWRMLPDDLKGEIGRTTLMARGQPCHRAAIRAAIDYLNGLDRETRMSA